MLKKITASAAVLLLSTAIAFAGECFAGDSLANGMAISYCAQFPKAQQAKCRAENPNVAKDGSRIEALLDQLKRCPAGATVRVSSGTNDSVSPYNVPVDVQRVLVRVIALADARGQTLIWYQPPAVTRSWDHWSHSVGIQISLALAASPRGASHRFVETRHIPFETMRDARGYPLRAPDGVHFSIPYGYLALLSADKN